jgi:hypothetical protein
MTNVEDRIYELSLKIAEIDSVVKAKFSELCEKLQESELKAAEQVEIRLKQC